MTDISRRIADEIAEKVTAALFRDTCPSKEAGRAIYASSTMGRRTAEFRENLAALKAEFGCTQRASSTDEYLACRR